VESPSSSSFEGGDRSSKRAESPQQRYLSHSKKSTELDPLRKSADMSKAPPGLLLRQTPSTPTSAKKEKRKGEKEALTPEASREAREAKSKQLKASRRLAEARQEELTQSVLRVPKPSQSHTDDAIIAETLAALTGDGMGLEDFFQGLGV